MIPRDYRCPRCGHKRLPGSVCGHCAEKRQKELENEGQRVQKEKDIVVTTYEKGWNLGYKTAKEETVLNGLNYEQMWNELKGCLTGNDVIEMMAEMEQQPAKRDDYIRQVKERALWIRDTYLTPEVLAVMPNYFFIAGNCLNGLEVPRDIDMFPCTNDQTKGKVYARLPRKCIVSQTSNAITWDMNGHQYQYCNYSGSLEELVNGFDYAHVQCGVYFSAGDIEKVYVSDEYIKAREEGTTWYCPGHDNPISALRRTMKFYKRGYFKEEYEAWKSMVDILVDIFESPPPKSIEDVDRQLTGIYGTNRDEQWKRFSDINTKLYKAWRQLL